MDVCLYVIGTYCGLCGGCRTSMFWLRGYDVEGAGQVCFGYEAMREITIKAMAVAASAPFLHNLLLNEY